MKLIRGKISWSCFKIFYEYWAHGHVIKWVDSFFLQICLNSSTCSLYLTWKAPSIKLPFNKKLKEKRYTQSLVLKLADRFFYNLGVVVNEFLIEFQQKQLQLRAKAMHLEVQISGLQKEGVSRLKQRMKEVSADKAKRNKIKGRL